jgi:large subunit ribosomal protein L30
MKNKSIEVKLVRSLIGSKDFQRSSVRGLGLSKIGQVISVPDTLENRGMIKAAHHLLEIKE